MTDHEPTPGTQEQTPEAGLEALKEELRQLFVGEDAPYPWRLLRHGNGLDYKRVTLTPQILERLSALLALQRDQTLDALCDYFNKTTEASVRKGCLNHEGEQEARIADQKSLIQLLMALIKSMPGATPTESTTISDPASQHKGPTLAGALGVHFGHILATTARGSSKEVIPATGLESADGTNEDPQSK